MLQEPPEREHDDGLKVPPALLSAKSTFPDGTYDGFAASLTDTMSVTEDPAFTVVEPGEIAMLVESGPAGTDVELLLVNTSPLSAEAKESPPEKPICEKTSTAKSKEADFGIWVNILSP